MIRVHTVDVAKQWEGKLEKINVHFEFSVRQKKLYIRYYDVFHLTTSLFLKLNKNPAPKFNMKYSTVCSIFCYCCYCCLVTNTMVNLS